MQKIIALDVGLKRVGVALGVGEVVLPLKPILRQNRDQAAREVSELLREYSVKTIVVGVPLNGASENEMKRRIEHFISLVKFDGEVIYQDEAYSSVEASELYSKSARDGKLDSIAAAVILKRYLGVL